MRFHKLMLMVGLLFTVHTTSAQTGTPTPDELPQPLIVWLYVDPWGEMPDLLQISDAPSFALYADGRVIYREEHEYRTVLLTADEVDDLMSSLPLVPFGDLKPFYTAILATDLPSDTLHIWINGQQTTVEVYGLDQDLEDEQADVPDVFRMIRDMLADYANPNAETWIPAQIEVQLRRVNMNNNPNALDWPGDWPDLNDSNAEDVDTLRPRVYLPAKELSTLQAMIREQTEAGFPIIVRLHEQTWMFTYRLPFPQEALWMPAES